MKKNPWIIGAALLLCAPLAALAHVGHGEHHWRELFGHPIIGAVELLLIIGAGVLVGLIRARRARRVDADQGRRDDTR